MSNNTSTPSKCISRKKCYKVSKFVTRAIYVIKLFCLASHDAIIDNIEEEHHSVQEMKQHFQESEVVQEEDAAAANVINVKQEQLDPTALHELAEISMRHAINSATSNLYKCEMCDEVFSDRAQLLVHVPIHI